MTSSRSQRRRQPVRSPQSRRPLVATTTTRNLEPPDYTREYDDVRHDLVLIAIIGGLLLAGMIAASFFL
jgi:Ni/Co efflux regulator RcnB